MRTSTLAGYVSLLLQLSVSAAFACNTGEVLFEDTLQSPDQSWGVSADTNLAPGPDGATWTMEPNFWRAPLSQMSLYEDFEVCVTVALEYPETSGGYAGVTFWAEDSNNSYSVDIFPSDGAFAVYRLQKAKTLKPVPYQQNSAVNTEPKAKNEISIVAEGKHAVVSINGTKVAEFNGIPPEGGGLVGIEMGTMAEDSGPTSVTFSNFQVREIAE